MKTLVPIKKILRAINSCQSIPQLENYRKVMNDYIKMAKKNNIANVDELNDRLEEEFLQRQEILYLSDTLL